MEPFDPGPSNRASLPKFRTTGQSPSRLELPPPPTRPRNEHPVNFVSFPTCIPSQQSKWFSSPLPVPKQSQSARRFTKPNSAIISVTSTGPPPLPFVAVLSHKSANRPKTAGGKGRNPVKSSKVPKQPKEARTRPKESETTQKEAEPEANVKVEPLKEATRLLVPTASFSLVKCQNQASNSVGERMQVVRTEEEKSRSPDTLRLDKCGLKQFPLIYPASEPRLRLISMQHNQITRLENVPSLNHLVVLDLYDNRIERINGLQGLNSLRVLLLGKNRLRRVEGLDSLKRLEVLDLHGNQLRFVGNLGCLASLRVLNLAGNHFKTVRLGQYGMTSLMELNLKRNRIRNLEGLQKAPHIRKLLLANNELSNISAVYPLRKLLFLQEVLLHPNPLCSSPDYIHQMISLLPSLQIVDRAIITDQMRVEAKSWHRKYLAEEEAKKAAQLKARLPTSREQVIFEAQQRWQSVKNFVKVTVAAKELAGRERQQNLAEPFPNTESETSSSQSQQLVSNELQPEFHPDTRLPKVAISDPEEIFLPAQAVLEAQLDADTALSDQKSLAADPSLLQGMEKISRIAIVRPLMRAPDKSVENCQVLYEPENDDCPSVTLENFDCSSGINKHNGVQIEPMDLKSDSSVALVEEDCVEQEEESHLVEPVNFDKISEDIETNLGHITEGMEGSNFDTVNNNPVSVSSEHSKDSETAPGELLNIFPKPRSHNKLLKRSASSFTLTQTTVENNSLSNLLEASERRKVSMSAKTRSASFDVRQPSSESSSDDDTSSFLTTNTSESSTAPKKTRKFMFRSRLRSKRDRPVTSKVNGPVQAQTHRRPQTSVRDSRPTNPTRPLRRSDSTASANNNAPSSPVGMKKQGVDYLVEVDGKILNVYGQGALKFSLVGFPTTMTAAVTTGKFHYISFDSIIPYFGKFRQTYPNMEHFQFRANNLCYLAQLNALADLQGIKSLHIMKEGNPIVANELWISYAAYRLSHWGLQVINGKEVSSDHKCNSNLTSVKTFESLGYVALSCLPQAALTPLAKKLHSLHCFCCCSPSTSSDDSGRKKAGPNGTRPTDPPDTVCSTWDDDPVLLDVIGKEALVYQPPTSEKESKDREEIPKKIINSGVEILEKLDMLEQVWPSVLAEIVQDILMDYLFMDAYMKKELKKLQDLALINKRPS